MKRKIVFLVSFAFLILYLSSLPSSSFLVRPLNGARHHAIAIDALQRIGGFGTIPYFGEISSLLAYGAEGPDLDAVLAGYWFLHFGGACWDSVGNCWEMSRSYRSSYREAAAFYAAMWSIDTSPNYNPPPEEPSYWIEDATWFLGLNFHCVADFYAHSNWVETHDLGVIADLEGPYIQGVVEGADKDSPAHIDFYEAYQDAVLATIKEWYLFEDKVYEMFPSTATYILHCMGVSSQITTSSPKAGEGLILGDTHKIIWYQSAIPHDTEVNIMLIMNGSPIGIIATVPIHNNQFSWVVGNFIGGQAVPNNTNPCYQIKISTLDGQYSETSGNFYINEPIYGAPTNLASKPTAWNIIDLTWNDGSNCETKFEIQRKEEGDSIYDFLKYVNKNVTHAEDTTVVPGVKYHYIVKALFNNGTYAFSEEASAQVPDDIEPYPPNFLSAEFLWNGEVKLTWFDVSSNEEEFIIERRSEWEPTFQEIAIVGPNETVYYDWDIWRDTFYYYRVKIKNPIGYSYSEQTQVYVPWW